MSEPVLGAAPVLLEEVSLTNTCVSGDRVAVVASLAGVGGVLVEADV